MNKSASLRDELIGKYIICSCEGHAEMAIMKWLLDEDRLIFRWDDVVDRECTALRSAGQISNNFLNREYEKPVAILRILDSHAEQFHLPRLYSPEMFPVFNIYTRPEIEILHIIHEGQWAAYKKHQKLKPSDFFKGLHPKERVKAAAFIQDYYRSVDVLVETIREYHRLAAGEKSGPQQWNGDLSDLPK